MYNQCKMDSPGTSKKKMALLAIIYLFTMSPKVSKQNGWFMPAYSPSLPPYSSSPPESTSLTGSLPFTIERAMSCCGSGVTMMRFQTLRGKWPEEGLWQKYFQNLSRSSIDLEIVRPDVWRDEEGSQGHAIFGLDLCCLVASWNIRIRSFCKRRLWISITCATTSKSLLITWIFASIIPRSCRFSFSSIITPLPLFDILST